jgi:hypothetical protein
MIISAKLTDRFLATRYSHYCDRPGEVPQNKTILTVSLAANIKLRSHTLRAQCNILHHDSQSRSGRLISSDGRLFSTRGMNRESGSKNVQVGYLLHKVRGDAGSVNGTSLKFRLERRQVISRFAHESSLFNSMTQHFRSPPSAFDLFDPSAGTARESRERSARHPRKCKMDKPAQSSGLPIVFIILLVRRVRLRMKPAASARKRIGRPS